jgi:hypothetical protein
MRRSLLACVFAVTLAVLGWTAQRSVAERTLVPTPAGAAEAEAAPRTIATIFDGETREPAWAGRREAALRALVERDLRRAGVDARLVNIECRHSTCELTFAGSDPHEAVQANRFMQYALLGSAYEPGPFLSADGATIFSARIAFEARDRDHDTWKQAYRERRRERLARLRRAGIPAGYPPLPRE